MAEVLRTLLLGAFLVVIAAPAAAAPWPNIAMIEWQLDGPAEDGFRHGILKIHPDARFHVYNAGADPDILSNLLESAVRRPHDLYYLSGVQVTRTVMEKVGDRPLVYTMVQAPVQEGIIPAWPYSDRNLTGISNHVPIPNQLRALKRIVDFHFLGVVYNPANPDSRQQLFELEQLQETLRFNVKRLPLLSAVQARSLDISGAPALDAVYLTHDQLIQKSGGMLLERINAAGIPSLAADLSLVTRKGALLGLVPEEYRIGRLAALSALEILAGTQPQQIPSRSLDYFMVAVNMRTAQRINVQVPLSLLVIADTIVR